MWFQIISWHYEAMTSRGGQPKGRCGKWGDRNAPRLNELPLSEKSCETCLRLWQHDQKE